MRRGARLSSEPDEVERLVRILDASVNVRILRALAAERRRGAGWLYLSQIAARLGEAPGTVGAAIGKLAPLVEERREKGLRWFRASVTDVTITMDEPSARQARARPPSRPRRAGARR